MIGAVRGPGRADRRAEVDFGSRFCISLAPATQVRWCYSRKASLGLVAVFLTRRVSFCGPKVGIGIGRATMCRRFTRHLAPFLAKHFVNAFCLSAIDSSSPLGNGSPLPFRFLVASVRAIYNGEPGNLGER